MKETQVHTSKPHALLKTSRGDSIVSEVALEHCYVCSFSPPQKKRKWKYYNVRLNHYGRLLQVLLANSGQYLTRPVRACPFSCHFPYEQVTSRSIRPHFNSGDKAPLATPGPTPPQTLVSVKRPTGPDLQQVSNLAQESKTNLL